MKPSSAVFVSDVVKGKKGAFVLRFLPVHTPFTMQRKERKKSYSIPRLLCREKKVRSHTRPSDILCPYIILVVSTSFTDSDI